MRNSLERRAIAGTADLSGRTFTGLAIRTNSPTTIGGRYDEQVAPDAVRAALARRADTVALWNHNPDNLLGRTANGTLRLAGDSQGMRSEIDLPDTVAGNTVATLTQRGDIRGQSFGFIARRDAWEAGRGGRQLRTLLDFDLVDVSPVTSPAYRDTTAGLRSFWHAQREGILRGVARTQQRASVTAPDAEGAIRRARAADAAVDAACDALADGNKAQAVDLLNAAAMAIDGAGSAFGSLSSDAASALGVQHPGPMFLAADHAINAALSTVQSSESPDPDALTTVCSAMRDLLAALGTDDPDVDDDADAMDSEPVNGGQAGSDMPSDDTLTGPGSSGNGAPAAGTAGVAPGSETPDSGSSGNTAAGMRSAFDAVAYERRYDTAQREQMAKDGEAMPDGSFPIATKDDVHSAIILWQSGHGATQSAKDFIIKRAKALGAVALLPKEWNVTARAVDLAEMSMRVLRSRANRPAPAGKETNCG